MIEGVLFDFSGTLFHLEPNLDWAPDDPRREMLDVLRASTRSADHLPPDLAEQWVRRDLDAETHRAVYLAVLTSGPLRVEAPVAESLYERMHDPVSWQPYPDTEPVLRRLRAAGVRVAVVSNIAWDIRTVFRRFGVEDLVDEYVVSYVEGVMKPDPKIFTVACQRIGVAPERALMIGDNEEADGGALSVGARFALVAQLPVADRPDALEKILTSQGL